MTCPDCGHQPSAWKPRGQCLRTVAAARSASTSAICCCASRTESLAPLTPELPHMPRAALSSPAPCWCSDTEVQSGAQWRSPFGLRVVATREQHGGAVPQYSSTRRSHCAAHRCAIAAVSAAPGAPPVAVHASRGSFFGSGAFSERTLRHQSAVYARAAASVLVMVRCTSSLSLWLACVYCCAWHCIVLRFVWGASLCCAFSCARAAFTPIVALLACVKIVFVPLSSSLVR